MSDGVLRERLAVLGAPIAHSKSPQIHAAAYQELGIDWAYDRQELQAADLAGYLESRDDSWRGFSLTMPLKEEAHRLATILDPIAERSGVVNTLLRLAGNAGWAGFNTDVGGLAAAVRGTGSQAERTVVLGAGATATSAVLATHGLGASHTLVLARRGEAATQLIERLSGGTEAAKESGLEALSLTDREVSDRLQAFDPTLVISTLPASAGAAVSLPEGVFSAPLFDVAYDPWPSTLATRWEAAGARVFPGTAMLVEQALLQIRIFVGGDPTVKLQGEERVLQVMRQAVA